MKKLILAPLLLVAALSLAGCHQTSDDDNPYLDPTTPEGFSFCVDQVTESIEAINPDEPKDAAKADAIGQCTEQKEGGN